MSNPHEERAGPYEDWAGRIRAGDRRAIARAITATENGGAPPIPLLKLLYPFSRAAHLVGVTGPPGAGKSTLIELIAGGYRKRGLKIGILAVDPTSQFSGGALLGDRIRMQRLSTDRGVYIRSMATRGQLGGIAAATSDAVIVLEAAGCDTVLVETVGVGQGEADIASIADATLVVLAPGMGDDVQALKAGVLEIADVFVINKADQPGADRLEHELISIGAQARGRWIPPVLQTVAATGQGVDRIERALGDFRAYCETSSLRAQRQREMWRHRLLNLVQEKLLERLARSSPPDGSLDAQVEKIVRRERDPYSAAEELMKEWGGR